VRRFTNALRCRRTVSVCVFKRAKRGRSAYFALKPALMRLTSALWDGADLESSVTGAEAPYLVSAFLKPLEGRCLQRPDARFKKIWVALAKNRGSCKQLPSGHARSQRSFLGGPSFFALNTHEAPAYYQAVPPDFAKASSGRPGRVCLACLNALNRNQNS
jgi:hypothetical protein